MSDAEEELAILVIRATEAFNEARKATSARARSKAETRFYANCESIYWLIRARSD